MGIFLQSLADAFRLIISVDPEVVGITWLSLKVSGLAVICSSLIGIPLAFFLSMSKFPGRKVVINVVHTFMGLPPVVAGLFVYIMLSSKGEFGWLDMLFSPLAMVIAQIVIATPIITGVSLAAINNVDNMLKETIVSLGATRWQKVIGILKEAKYGIITAIVTGFGRAISEVGAIIIVGGNIQYYTRALTTAIVLETRRGNFELALALGIILLAIGFLVNWALTSIQQRIVKR